MTIASIDTQRNHPFIDFVLSTFDMRTYYHDNLPSDPRLPHDYNPSQPRVSEETLNILGIHSPG